MNLRGVIKLWVIKNIKEDIIKQLLANANPKKFSADLKIFNISAKEKWAKDKKRLQEIKREGYNVRVIWESDWNSFKMNEISERKFIKLTKVKWYEYIEVMCYKTKNYFKEVSNRIQCKLA